MSAGSIPPDVKPCPFCGSGRLETQKIWGDRRRVVCMKCRATGPAGLTLQDAYVRWDKRVDLNEGKPKQGGLF